MAPPRKQAATEKTNIFLRLREAPVYSKITDYAGMNSLTGMDDWMSRMDSFGMVLGNSGDWLIA